MDFYKVASILESEGIRKKLSITENEIKEEMINQDDDYYSAKFNGEKWVLICVRNERRSEPLVDLISEFNDKASAARAFLLQLLRTKYLFNEIGAFKNQVNWYERIESVTIVDLQNALNQLGIPSEYLSVNEKRPHTMHVFEENGLWRTGYFDITGNMVWASRLDSLSFSVSVAFSSILSLYLVDKMAKKYLDVPNAPAFFSTKEILDYM